MIQDSQTIQPLTHLTTDLPSPSVRGKENWPLTLMKERGLEEMDTRLETAVAEFKGQVLSELKNQQRDLSHINEKLDVLVTRRELEAAQKDNDRAMQLLKSETERRIGSLEEDRRWGVRQIIMIWLAGIPTAAVVLFNSLRKTL